MRQYIRALVKLGVPEAKAREYILDLVAALPSYGITNTKIRLAHFISQLLHESGYFKYDEENLNYSSKALRRVFRKYFKTEDIARQYARKPSKIASRVYGGRMGNGPESTGDGWKYRGRGLIQLTGKDNYKRFALWMGEPSIVNNPDLVASDYGVYSAVFYWTVNNLNKVADRDDVRLLTKRINGGYNGLDHRRELYKKTLLILDRMSLDF